MRGFVLKMFLFLVFFICLGLIREHIFVNINNIIHYKYYKSTNVPIPVSFGWLTRFSYVTLYYLKYPLTILFVAIYYFANYYFLRQFRVKKMYIKMLTLAYIVLLALSILLMLYGYIVKQQLNAEEYTISRGLMGLAQSPLISFVLFTLYLWDKNKWHHYEKRNTSI